MDQLVECVPNFSEGRDQAKVRSIVAAARAVPGVRILDVETDADHHRCVLSFVAPPMAALEACFEAARKARELIDLNVHKGEHPRIGAVDVIPFIPVFGVTIEACIALAEQLGERIGRDLGIPVYLYDHAARRPERKDLAAVRKGQFEDLRQSLGRDVDRVPDFGPNRVHPTAGAVAVGARQQIVNLNFNLDSKDIEAGKDIARRLRASGGGLPCVRAKEIYLAARKQVQISTVLTDYKITPMRKVVEETERLAAAHHSKILSAEIVGLLPRAALVDFAIATLELEHFRPDVQILERQLESLGILGASIDWRGSAAIVAQALANTEATPGGGAAAAIAGAMGCGLGLMAIGISLKSKKIGEHQTPILSAAQKQLIEYKDQFHLLMSEDAAAFDAVMTALALPKDDISRSGRIEQTLTAAAEVPLLIMQAAADALDTIDESLSSAQAAVASDMNCATHLLRAAAQCAAENVRINLAGIKDGKAVHDLEARLSQMLQKIDAHACG